MFKKLMIGALVAVLAAINGLSAIPVLAAPTAEVQSPTTGETAGLLYMFQEEKMARDVYDALYVLWGQPTFQNIALSEQVHLDAFKTLLVRYGIPDPGTAAGIFTDPTLQTLYTDLMATGSLSLMDALKVGATIEEVDITDLQSRLTQTTNADIQMVYNNLMRGSYSHLRSFVTVLKRLTDEVYHPKYLSADLYQSILTSSAGKGQAKVTSAFTTRAGQGYNASTCVPANPMSIISDNGMGYRGSRH